MFNPFQIFDLPVDFQLDEKALNTRYLELQKALHPDNFVSSSALEQRVAMQKSTEVNDALKTLKDPILRADTRCGVFNATVTVARTTRRT